jgi:hypothetical protein
LNPGPNKNYPDKENKVYRTIKARGNCKLSKPQRTEPTSPQDFCFENLVFLTFDIVSDLGFRASNFDAKNSFSLLSCAVVSALLFGF